jgi:hypothetical protein
LLRRLQICEDRADFKAAPAERIAFAKREFCHPVGAVLDPVAVAALE